MSVVTLQIGQCGNQVGCDWFTSIARELGLDKTLSLNESTYINESLERWFYTNDNKKHFARAVLIDTEPKVVHEVCGKTATQFWKYNPCSIACRNDGGSGNNWALGHYIRGYEMQEAIFNSIRKETENCDRFFAFNNILSCAGGTGSGLGSYIITHLRDEYPTKCIINSLILPYEGGEIVTQNYNIVLSFSKLYNISNVHIIFENDDLLEICYDRHGNTSIGLHDLNSIISLKLSSFLQPVNKRSHSYLPSIISDLTPHPGFKMISVKNPPHFFSQNFVEDNNLSWKFLLKSLLRLLRTPTCKDMPDCKLENPEPSSDCKLENLEPCSDCKLENPEPSSDQKSPKYECCVANTLITRGDEKVNDKDLKDFRSPVLYPEWNPDDTGFNHLHQKEMLFKMHKFVTLISNNSSLYNSLNGALKKAWAQYSQKAYLHHYTKYGLTEEEIVEAFVKIEDVAANYKELIER